MPKHDMEDIFRKKLEDFEAPHGDRWENISAALPPQNKKRRAFWLWFSAGTALLIGFVSFLLYSQLNHPAANSVVERMPKSGVIVLEDNEPAQKVKSDIMENDIDEKSEKHVKRNYLTSDNLHWGTKTFSEVPEEPVRIDDTTPSSENSPNEPFNEENSPSKKEPQQEIPIDPLEPEKIDPDTSKLNNPDGPEKKPGQEIKPSGKSSNAPISRWSMGFGMGIYASRFSQQMPNQQGNTNIEAQGMVQKNQELRREMEKTGIAFSQSLWIQYQPFEHWSFSTGISMVQTTQKLAFNVKSNVPDSVRGPQDFPEIGTTGPGSDYLFENDSIQPGSMYSATNKYFAREIPFFVNYHLTLSKKMDVQFSVGASYRWITGASVFFADIDNVGMIYLNGPAYYPGLRGTWNLQGGIAVNYHLNDHFDLNLMPSFQLALQSNIRHKHYVQQYQRQWGLQVRLTRKLGF